MLRDRDEVIRVVAAIHIRDLEFGFVDSRFERHEGSPIRR
jgi:hypothetical protein